MLGYMLEKEPEEIYRVTITDTGFSFHISESAYVLLVGTISQKLLHHLSEIPVSQRKEVTTFTVPLPYIPLPNKKHKEMDWGSLGEASKKLELLLDLGNDLLLHEDASKITLSKKKQLVVINTRFRDDDDAFIWVGLSPYAKSIMKADDESRGTLLAKCRETMAKTYFGLSCTSQREHQEQKRLFSLPGGFSGINAHVRDSGVPHFTVPGNCACLGANLDDFDLDGDLTPHNIDTSLQQISMFAGVVEFWNSYLRAFE
jgi:hypothetical protein